MHSITKDLIGQIIEVKYSDQTIYHVLVSKIESDKNVLCGAYSFRKKKHSHIMKTGLFELAPNTQIKILKKKVLTPFNCDAK